MNKNIIYARSYSLDEKIREQHFIPYRVKGDHYIRGKRYYNGYWDMCFRVFEVKYDKETNELEHIYVKADDNTYHLLTFDLDACDFVLKEDFKKLYNKRIINSEEVYTGAEIVYWFYINNIDCFNKKYKGFWKFVDSNSRFRISDNTRYRISGDYDKELGKYVNCKIKRDTTYDGKSRGH